MEGNGIEVVVASAGGKEVKEIEEREEVKHYEIPFTRVISPFQDLRCLWKIIKLIKKENPDIVHTHTPKAGLIGMMAAWYCKVPIRMHTVAGMPLMEAKGIKKTLLKLTERLTYRTATNIYPNSFNLKNWIAKNFKMYESKIEVLANGSSNGIDVSYFVEHDEILTELEKIKLKYKIHENDMVYIFVGRLVQDKGIHELVRAFEALDLKGGQNPYLFIVGAYEDDREPVDEEIKKIIKTSENIIHVGFQCDIRPYLMISDIFVFPSYREGFPNVVMQAGCFNLPCIVTDINGSNEIIKDGYNGLIVSPKEVEELRAAMMKLGNDSMLRKRMGQEARKQIVSNYDQQIVWKAILKEYKRLLILHGVRRPN